MFHNTNMALTQIQLTPFLLRIRIKNIINKIETNNLDEAVHLMGKYNKYMPTEVIQEIDEVDKTYITDKMFLIEMLLICRGIAPAKEELMIIKMMLEKYIMKNMRWGRRMKQNGNDRDKLGSLTVLPNDILGSIAILVA